MENVIIVIVVVAIITFALLYIYREKKKGVACIGCPAAAQCSRGKNGSGCNRHCNGQEQSHSDINSGCNCHK